MLKLSKINSKINVKLLMEVFLINISTEIFVQK